MEIIIVAPNIKTGGGKELLYYLIDYLLKNRRDVRLFVYLDNSLAFEKSHPNLKIFYLSNVTSKIKLFTKPFKNAIYFGNLPPLVRSRNSFVYFHNPYLIKSFWELKNTSLKLLVKYTLQKTYIKLFGKNVDFFACQNKFIEKGIKKIYGFSDIRVLPFYNSCPAKQTSNIYRQDRKQFDFCYVSLAYPHKNHHLLLDAVELLGHLEISLRLALTVESSNLELQKRIDKINQSAFISITNFGMVSKSTVCDIYSLSCAMVFPSLEETFGLGLIEAVDAGIPVIASNLAYVFESIEPSAVFDPTNAEDLANKLKAFHETPDGFPQSLSKVKNQIDSLIESVAGVRING